MRSRWKLIAVSIVMLAAYLGLSHFCQPSQSSRTPGQEKLRTSGRTIQDTIGRGETLFDIFKKNGLNMADLFTMREAAASVHHLRNLQHGRKYVIAVDNQNCIDCLVYWIDDEFLLKVKRKEDGFQAERRKIPYERRILTFSGSIGDNLVSSIGDGKEHLLLALKLSDIFAWDIDFASDIRRGDTYAVVVEGLYIDGQFKKYGDILSALFINKGKRHKAYRFELNGEADYYDGEGNSLKKAFLNAPLNFRRISSLFSRTRLHPVLRIYRPHHGVDYAAPRGTPVSATREGSVLFAGPKGRYGKLVAIRHDNQYVTLYGHLSAFARGIRSGITVRQGEVIGYVGATGLATGPHLHYEIRHAGRFVDPLTVNGPRSSAVPQAHLGEFRKILAKMESILECSPDASIASAL